MARKVKERIRKEISETLNNQAGKEAVRKSAFIKKKLFSLPEFKKAKLVMFYASKQNEVDTGEMIDEALRTGKRVALPRCVGQKTFIAKEISNRHTDLEKGAYGIYEPRKKAPDVDIKEIGLVVVPGVAFDIKNRRLGRGKGYYDRFLKKLPPGRTTIGLAFSFQMVKNLPKDSHDIPVSKVITD